MENLTATEDNRTITGAMRQALTIAGKIHDPPPNFSAFGPFENAMWEYIMKSRDYDSWSASDLVLAARFARLEGIIKKGEDTLQQMIDAGADLFDEESYANSYHKQLMKAQAEQRQNLRALGMTRTSVRSDLTTEKKRAEAEQKAKKAYEEFGVDPSAPQAAFLATT